MRRRISVTGIITATAACFALSAVPAFANESGTVTAQVTVASPCLTLTKTSLDFGTGLFSQPSQLMDQRHAGLGLSSCSGGSQLLYGRGTNATASDGSGAAWSLIPAGQQDLCGEGPNKFFLVVDLLSGGTSIGRTGLTASNQLLGTNSGAPYQLAAGATADSDQILFMPCAGSAGGGKTMSFQLTYTASF